MDTLALRTLDVLDGKKRLKLIVRVLICQKKNMI